VQFNNPFLLRTAIPAIDSFIDCRVQSIERMGKRIVLGFEGEPRHDKSPALWMVFHLMIAGRLHWKAVTNKSPGKSALIVLQFEEGYLYLTEAGSKRRASLHLFESEQALNQINPGGLEVLETSYEQFVAVFTAKNHTLKRALTDPHILSGIGNAYSDEILHKAKLSPIKMTQKLDAEELRRLFTAIQESLEYWANNLRHYYGDKFPEKVTAFREDMAVHGRYGKPCPECASPVQRICYSSNETNYCPTCQTEGRILADRALSQLLKKDWPRTLEELEQLK
jgi:formamidopyrimidine-DNA glycosylase